MTVLFRDVARSVRPLGMEAEGAEITPASAPALSVIIPTYNEAANIRELIARVAASLQGISFEILVIDDDSPDRTWEFAEKERGPIPLEVVRRTQDRGLASAVVTGFKRARGDFIAVLDADLSHPPAVLPLLFHRVVNGADLVVASRIVSGGGVEDWPFHRRALSWVGRLIARPLTPVRDNMSGYFLMRRSVVDGVLLRTRGYKILLEILVRGNHQLVEELPYVFLNREVGKSKMTAATHAQFLLQLSELYRSRFQEIVASLVGRGMKRERPKYRRISLVDVEGASQLSEVPFHEAVPPLTALQQGNRPVR